MKKMMLVAICVVALAAFVVAQNPQYANPVGGVTGGIQGIDKLGAHQNGGRGCVGCHAPHSGARGNGGNAMAAGAVTDPTTGDETLWGQDIGPLYSLSLNTGNATTPYVVAFPATNTGTRVVTGIMYCLSCHDGNVAKGAMMTGKSFEQAANLLPAGLYGAGDIPTLLGNDGTAAGNYQNDHPIGPSANLGALGSRVYNYFALDAANTKVIAAAAQPDTKYNTFITNYGSPTILGARVGAGFVVETAMAGDQKQAYVVCTTCHTPHSMYTSTASPTNPIATLTAGTFPSFFFIAAPYNPGANVAQGTKASSATQFCRQCHFSGAGGSNESAGISISTAF